MFRTTDQQVSLFESQFLLSPEKVARLQKSWAEPFQKRILPLIDEEVFRDVFSEDNGRPNTSIRLLVSLHILKEWNDLTDEQVLDQLEFNLQWHYALAVEPGQVHTCQKTLHNFRTKLMESKRAQEMFQLVTAALAEADGLGLGRQRLDSTHVLSNIAVLTRLGLFVETVTHFLKELRRNAPGKLEAIDDGYVKRYLEREGYFADAKREQARRRLPVVAKDVMRLVASFENDKEVQGMESYQLLVRLFEDQCEVVKGEAQPVLLDVLEASGVEVEEGVEDAGVEDADIPSGSVEPGDQDEPSSMGRKDTPARSPDAAASTPSTDDPERQPSVRLKEGRDVRSDSLQSPYDPDATYGHKGKGYEVQVAETCDDDNPYQLITGIAVGGAHESDQNAVIPMVEQLAASGLKPDELQADTGYGSGQNIIDCAKIGVDLQAPVRDPDAPPPTDHWKNPVEPDPPQRVAEELSQARSSDGSGEPSDAAAAFDLDAFTFNATYNEILSCPAGHAPKEQHLARDERLVWATFSSEHCGSCPFALRCPTRLKMSGERILQCGPAKAATAHRQRKQQTPEFKERYKKRSGVESTNAELKGRHGADDIRVRGRHRLTLSMQLKALALNVKRAVQYHTECLKELSAQLPRAAPLPV